MTPVGSRSSSGRRRWTTSGSAARCWSLADRLADRAGIEVDRRIERGLPSLTYEQELVLYRVAQEALTNVVRHAGASRAELSLARNGGTLELQGPRRRPGSSGESAATAGASAGCASEP